MNAIRFLETPIQHGSDVIRWYDASGFNDSAYRPRITQPLDIRIHQGPRDLALQHRRGRTALWRKRQSAAALVVDGRARGDQLEPPGEVIYEVGGEVRDPARIFNPRLFNINAGNAFGHELALYRSPLGSKLHTAGGLQVSIAYDSGDPASWALVTVNVVPLLGAPINFIAQADIYGELVLPLTRLPGLNSSASNAAYPALMHISADGASGAQIPNLDDFVSFRIADFSTPSTFNTSVAFDVSPGSIQHLSSAGDTNIIIQST